MRGDELSPERLARSADRAWRVALDALDVDCPLSPGESLHGMKAVVREFLGLEGEHRLSWLGNWCRGHFLQGLGLRPEMPCGPQVSWQAVAGHLYQLVIEQEDQDLTALEDSWADWVHKQLENIRVKPGGEDRGAEVLAGEVGRRAEAR